MSKNKLRGFDEMFEGWPAGVPVTGPELISVDWGALKSIVEDQNTDPDVAQTVYDLRAHGVLIRNSATIEPALSSPAAVALMLGRNLRPPKDRWITYVLDDTFHRVSAPHKSSGSRYLCDITVIVPASDELLDCPAGGHYILVRNDTIDVVSTPGVINRIESLARNVALSDVIIWDTTNENDPTTYSLRSFIGAIGNTPVPIEVDALLEQKVRKLWHA
jgi:hypothetical protein